MEQTNEVRHEDILATVKAPAHVQRYQQQLGYFLLSSGYSEY